MNQVTVWVYMVRCADGAYYIGKYQGELLETRLWDHNHGRYPDSYTAKRLPVEIVWSEWFSRYDDAVACKRKLKGWSRAKKEALIRGDEAALKILSRRGFRPSPFLRDAPDGAPQDEGLSVGWEKDANKMRELHPEEARSAVTKDQPQGDK